MSDRFFTFMIVPERSDRIRKVSLPTWLLRIGGFFFAAFLLITLLVLFDYIHMLSQVAENKKLRVENRMLKIEIQTAKTKVETLDQSVSRLKSFAHKLRVISNLDNPAMQRVLDKPPEGLKVKEGVSGEEGGSIGEEVEGDQSSYSAPTEDSGEGGGAPMPTKEADLHSRLEYQRSRTVVDEFGNDFDTQELSDQVAAVIAAADKLMQVTVAEESAFADLQEHLQDRVFRLLSTPSLLPAEGYISSEFGTRYNPFSAKRTFHAGLDIANHIGTIIVAPADGKVVKVGFMGGFGNVVKIDHGYGIATKYGHTSKTFVQPGDRVKRGQKIAAIGNSGRSTGPHLHYQVEVNGKPVQPRLFILDDI